MSCRRRFWRLSCGSGRRFEDLLPEGHLDQFTACPHCGEMVVQVGFESDAPIFARPPKTVELEITYTEPAVKGDTSNKVMKAATVETGAEINVPIFVEVGTVIRIDTESGEYMDRVKK